MRNLKNIISIALAILMLAVPSLGMIKEISAADGYTIPVELNDEKITVKGLEEPLKKVVEKREITLSFSDLKTNQRTKHCYVEISNPKKVKRKIYVSIINNKIKCYGGANLIITNIFKGDSIKISTSEANDKEAYLRPIEVEGNGLDDIEPVQAAFYDRGEGYCPSISAYFYKITSASLETIQYSVYGITMSSSSVIDTGTLNPGDTVMLDKINMNTDRITYKLTVVGGDNPTPGSSDNEETEKKIAELEEKINTLTNELSEKDTTISEKTTENDKLKSEIAEIKKQIEALKAERDKLKKDAEQGGTASEEVQKELETTKKALTEREADLEKAKKELEDLKKANSDSLDQAKTNAKDQISKINDLDEAKKSELIAKVDNAQTVEDVNKILSDLVESNLNNKLSEKDKVIAEKEANINKANKQIEDLKAEIEALKEKLATSTGNNDETQKLIDEKNEKIKELENAQKEAQQELGKLKEENKQLKDRIAELEKTIDSSDDEKAKKIAEKEKEIADLTEKVKELEIAKEKLATAEADKAKADEKIKELESKLANKESDLSGKQAELEKSNKELEKAKSKLEGDLKAKVEELEKVKSELAKIKKEQEEKDDIIAAQLKLAKDKAKEKINNDNTLTDSAKEDAIKKIDEAKTKEEVDKIIEDLKLQKDEDNKKELKEAKDRANKEIDKMTDLTDAERDELKRKVDSATSVKDVNDIVQTAKNNANDPAYQKDKLRRLAEEAKRVRYPSEELEKAIDEAYTILIDKYSRIEDYKWAIENIQKILQNMRDNKRNRFKLEVEDINVGDKEITGKTESKWYIDVYNKGKRVLNGQADYKGNFTIEIKKDRINAKDKLKVVATDPLNDKKYKEVEVVVGGDASVTSNNGVAITPDMLKAEGKDPNEMAVFPIGKNYYNIIENGKKTTVYMDVNSYAQNGRTMIPIRFAANALGYNVEYDEVNKEAIFTNTSNPVLAKATFRMNVYTGYIYGSNGTSYQMDQKPVIKNERTFVSISNLAKAFGGTHGNVNEGARNTIEWDQANYSAILFKYAK